MIVNVHINTHEIIAAENRNRVNFFKIRVSEKYVLIKGTKYSKNLSHFGYGVRNEAISIT